MLPLEVEPQQKVPVIPSDELRAVPLTADREEEEPAVYQDEPGDRQENIISMSLPPPHHDRKI